MRARRCEKLLTGSKGASVRKKLGRFFLLAEFRIAQTAFGLRKDRRVKQLVSAVITDLDNTLFDWVEVWYQCFSAMLDNLIEISGVDREKLILEIKQVHERHGTAEYAFLIEEVPSLAHLYPEKDRTVVYATAIEAYREARRKHLRLYPGVADTLRTLKDLGVLVIGYTESMAFYTNYRVRRLGLDGLVDYIYSPEDHDLPKNLSMQQIRKYPAHLYELQYAEHRHTPKGELKPNPKILTEIIKSSGAKPEECIYVGDSLMKDVAMAQEAGITDIYALYGKAQNRPEYELLRKVTHWTAEQVARERAIDVGQVSPSHVLEASFSQILGLFSFKPFRDSGVDLEKKLGLQVEIWKKVVDVQQHFNDIEMRIRNVAITIFGTILGAVGFSIKEHLQVTLFGASFSLGIFLLFVGLLTWGGFYLMDRFWYHRLLYGAVKQGIRAEESLKYVLPEIQLAKSIGDESPLHLSIGDKKLTLHSTHKMDIFYGIGALCLLTFILGLLLQP